VLALQRSSPPGFGIAGPLDLNNEKLMTQSFASCAHVRIFGFYYPWRFKNWFSDNWAAQLYAERTYWLTDIEVLVVVVLVVVVLVVVVLVVDLLAHGHRGGP